MTRIYEGDLTAAERAEFQKGLGVGLPFERRFIRKSLPTVIRGDSSYASRRLPLDGVESVAMMACGAGWMSLGSISFWVGLLSIFFAWFGQYSHAVGYVVIGFATVAYCLMVVSAARGAWYKRRFKQGA